MTQVTPLPSAPSRSDPPATFISKSDAFLASLANFVTEINTALGAVNISLWVSGTTYTAGTSVVWSPIDLQAYRRKTNGAGTTDPSIDPTNWQRLEVSATSVIGQYYTKGTTAGTSTAYTLTPVMAITAYAAGQSFWVTFHAASGTAPTLQVSGLSSPPNLVRQDSTGAYVNIAANEIPANHRSRVTLISTTQALVEEMPPASAAISTVRQTVLSGATNSSGLPAALSVGSGLAVNLSATATPLVLSAAKGFGSSGASDQIEVLNADVTGVVTLPASNTSYIYRALASVWGSTLAPPQYGMTYNQAAQSCLSLNNVATDDFGNSWTNTAVTFANSTPKYAGTYYGVFNGTTSKLQAAGCHVQNNGSWTARGAFYSTSIATLQCLYSDCSTTGFGIVVYLQTSKINVNLSSAGVSNDIGTIAGATTLSSNTWYDWELTYDPVAGKYYLYLNGTQEGTPITSATKVYGSGQGHVVGAYENGSGTYTNYFVGNIQGFEVLPYCKHPAGSTFTPQTALADVTTAGYASNWFSTVDYKLYTVSAKSTVAGTNPTFTSSAKVYAGEAVTGAATVTSVTNYAYQGRYDQTFTTIATSTSKNHNLGMVPGRLQLLENNVTQYRNLTLDSKVVTWTAVAATSRLIIDRGWA